ncbi:MAG: hypothetical protein K0Q43_1487 [Ramlibacter sp.]|nr:hypothetical protein [Ramlibacter sp.]MDF2463252.1 hypothetical protein [Ramlibacter sp.]
MASSSAAVHIDAYYKTNQSHLAWSFWASLTALVVGLIVLVVGIGLALAGFASAISVATAAGGVLTQFIGAGFFFLYTRNLTQLNVFYASLIQRDDLVFAYNLTSLIPEDLKPGVIQGMIGALLSRSGPSTELTADLVRALNEKRP